MHSYKMNQHASTRLAGTAIAACLTAFASGGVHAQSSVTLYGLIDTSITYATHQRTHGAGSPGSYIYGLDFDRERRSP